MTRGRIWIFAVVVLLLTLTSIVTVQNGLGFGGKTLFAWMDILIIPIALGIALYLLEQSQRSREQSEQRRREEELERTAALEEYIHQMGQAVEEYGLSRAKPDDGVAVLARARTLSILGTLDPIRKGKVVSFLSGARLINRDNPIVVLDGADLTGAFLQNQPIREIDLAGAYLYEATLIAADLYSANLSQAALRQADLSISHLRRADLSGANLIEADLSQAYLGEADLSEAYLEGAYLREAYLGGANLSRADLSGADLSGADLRGAYLSEADLRELSKTANLTNVTMPNGQKYEDWLEDKEGRDEDEATPSPK